MIRLFSGFLLIFGLVAGNASSAATVADFYRGKQIRVIAGSGIGGAYDAMARLLSRYLGQYVPGNPAVIVENMPGASGLTAANYIFNTAPKDGTVIGTFSRDIPTLAVLGLNSNVRFDPREFIWLGSPSSYANDGYLLWARADAKVKSIQDLRGPGTDQLVLASEPEGSAANDNAIFMRDVLQLKNLKIVAGYSGDAAEGLAIDRHEADAMLMGFTATSSLRPQWLKPDSGMRVLLQFARSKRLPQFPGAPTADELASDPQARALLAFSEIPFKLAWPMAAPPGLPSDRADALRSAFLAVQTDAKYLAEAQRLKLDISPIGGSELSSLIEQLYSASPEVLDRMRRLRAGSGKD